MGETEFFLQDPVIEIDNGVAHKDNLGQGQASNNFENVISAMGPPGRYQILQCILMGANLIPVVFVNMNFVFIGLEPPFSCLPTNETSLIHSHVSNMTSQQYRTFYDDCQIRIISNSSGIKKSVINTLGCQGGYNYKGGKHVSIVTEWDLVCEERGMAEMTQSFMSLGWFVGVFFSSAFSDKFGRKKTIGIAAALSSICELSCAFSPSIYVMIGLRFFSGFFGSGLSAVTFVLGEEMLVSRHRATFGVYLGLLWSFYAMLLCGIAYAFREHSWRDLQLCLALFGMTPLLVLYFLDESASWLYSKGYYKKASGILQKSCKLNGADYSSIKPTWDELCAQEIKRDADADKKAAKDYNISDLFRNKNLRASVFIAWVAFFTNDFSYFGMYLSASTLAGNLYLNTAIMAVSEFPGCFWVLAMLRRKGRRWVIVFFMSIGIVCLLVSTSLSSTVVDFTQHVANASTAFFLLGKLAISNSHTTTYLYIPELFPTTLRASGMGISLTGGCLGGMLAPYLLPLHGMVRWVPGACLIGVLTTCVILLSRLPETKGKQLESTIE